MNEGLIVKGVSWPFKWGPRGHANRVEKTARIRENLEALAMFKKGERIRERDVGTIGHSLMGRNTTSSKMALVISMAQETMAKYEPNATILPGVSWSQSDRTSGTITYLKVPFEVKAFQEEDVAESKIGE